MWLYGPPRPVLGVKICDKKDYLNIEVVKSNPNSLKEVVNPTVYGISNKISHNYSMFFSFIYPKAKAYVKEGISAGSCH